MIKVIGLGTKDGDLSLRGACAIDEAEVVIIKTALTPTYAFFEQEGIEHLTCDEIYDTAENFEELDTRIADFVIGYEGRNTVYCVNGSGIDDRSVIELKKRTKIDIIPCVSRETASLVNAPSTSYTAVSAYDVADDESFDYDSSYTLVIKDVDNCLIAGKVKATLSRIAGEERPVLLCTNEGSKIMSVYEIDREKEYSFDTSIVLSPLRLEDKEVYNYIDLLRVMNRLRGVGGCDWDRAQTHKSIRNNALEEAYELVEAINNEDIDNIIEEAGDVILQGVFHTVIGVDEGEFEIQEVLSGLCKKLISRHTHIFGEVVANNAEEALSAWEAAKAKEKSHNDPIDKIMGVAKAEPALMRAQKIQKIVKKAGMDFPDIESAAKKVEEELSEYLQSQGEEKEMEGGDLLFAVVNVLRLEGIDPEVALSSSTAKFVNRFSYVYSKAKQSDRDIKDIDFDRLWEEAKANENR